MLTFELTPKQELQRQKAASSARHILAYGGSRSGKTFGFCRCIAVRALSAPRSRHLIARLHNIDVRQSVMMDTWPSMMSKAFSGVDYEINRSDQVARFDNEAEVWFGGLDDKDRVEKILGKEYATIYPNETSQISYETILTLRTRLAQKIFKINGEQLALKGYYDLNPVGRSHWTYAEFVQGLNPVNHQPYPAGSRAWIQMNPIDNSNLPPEYLEELASMPERQRQRFLDGNYLSEVPGALWPLERLDETRVAENDVPQLARIVVAIDPSGSDGTGGDAQGIIVAGKGADGHGYVLEDGSLRGSPRQWARRAVQLYHKHEADCIVAESNYGGAMVESTIRSEDPHVPIKLVNASRGKHVRAEPVAALYERHDSREATMHHVGNFPELEDQMASFTTSGYEGSGSPDRADALVWAATELMLEEQHQAWVLTRRRA